jgi:hypothetical protein
LAGLAAPSFAALSYDRFSHPKGDYVVEYPSDWKRSIGIETLRLRPAGTAGGLTRVSIEKHPLGVKDPATPADFVAALLKDAEGVRKLDARETIKVAGRDAERLTFTETAALKGKNGTYLPGPMSEIVIVVPFQKGYYALRLSGMGDGLAGARPEFDRMVSGLKLGPRAR